MERAEQELEYDRLCRVNGIQRTRRAFAAQRQDSGIEGFLGLEDRQFLSKRSCDSRFPAAQRSGEAFVLHRAVEVGDLQAVVNLFTSRDQSCIDSIRNSHGEALLHTAVLHEQLPIVQFLLEKGARVDVALPNRTNRVSVSTLESVAPRSDNFKYSRVLSSVEATPLHYACATGNLDILKLLLAAAPSDQEHGVGSSRRFGSLLVWAITCAQVPVVDFLLLKKRLERDCFDEEGNNAIGIAALVLATEIDEDKHNNPNAEPTTLKRMLRVLVRCEHIDINHKNMHGLTAYDVAETESVKRLISRHGGKTAHGIELERLLRWDREKSREEFTYCAEINRRRAIRLRESSALSSPPTTLN